MKNQYHRLRRTSHLEFSKQDFNSMCDVLQSEVGYCMTRIENSCNDVTRQSAIRELNQTFNYFCYSGWNDYQKFQSCFHHNKKKVQEKVRLCYSSSELHHKHFFEHDYEYGNRDFRRDFGTFFDEYDITDMDRTDDDGEIPAGEMPPEQTRAEAEPENDSTPDSDADADSDARWNRRNWRYFNRHDRYRNREYYPNGYWPNRGDSNREYYNKDYYGQEYYNRNNQWNYDRYHDRYYNRRDRVWRDNTHGNEYYTRSYERLNSETPEKTDGEFAAAANAEAKPDPAAQGGDYYDDYRNMNDYGRHDMHNRPDRYEQDYYSWRHYNRYGYDDDQPYHKASGYGDGYYYDDYGRDWRYNNNRYYYGRNYWRHDMNYGRPEYWAFYNYDAQYRNTICNGLMKMRQCSHEMKNYCNKESDNFMYNLNNMMWQFGRLFMNCEYSTHTPSPLPEAATETMSSKMCNHHEALTCVQPFQSWFYSFKDNEMRMFADSDTLSNMCSVMQKQIFPCIQRETQYCTSRFQYPFRILTESFNYLCQPPVLKDLMSHNECWRSHSANVTFNLCKELMQSKMLYYYHKQRGDMMRYTCGLMSEFQRCTYMMDCDQPARDFLNTYLNRALSPARSFFNCDSTGNESYDFMKTVSWYEYLPKDMAMYYRNYNYNN